MVPCPRFAFMAWALLMAVHARADWVEPSAAYLCDRSKGVLSIASVMETSSPEDPATVKAPPGFLPLASQRNFVCKLGRTAVRARIRVRPPQPTGTCGGMRQTYLESFRVNGKEVFPEPTSINLRCLNDEDLYSIEVKDLNGATSVEVCYAAWDWGVGYYNVRCKSP